MSCSLGRGLGSGMEEHEFRRLFQFQPRGQINNIHIRMPALTKMAQSRFCPAKIVKKYGFQASKRENDEKNHSFALCTWVVSCTGTTVHPETSSASCSPPCTHQVFQLLQSEILVLQPKLQKNNSVECVSSRLPVLINALKDRHQKLTFLEEIRKTKNIRKT